MINSTIKKKLNLSLAILGLFLLLASAVRSQFNNSEENVRVENIEEKEYTTRENIQEIIEITNKDNRQDQEFECTDKVTWCQVSFGLFLNACDISLMREFCCLTCLNITTLNSPSALSTTILTTITSPAIASSPSTSAISTTITSPSIASTPSTSAISNVCPADQFPCLSGGCIPSNWKCDGYTNCIDSSDEFHCICSKHQFACSTGGCIPIYWKCNGIANCKDHSDEINCPCSHDQFMCSDGGCIPINWRCDGYSNCRDSSDEINCPCTSSQFTCFNGGCIPGVWKCDGYNNCGDGSDEMNCSPPVGKCGVPAITPSLSNDRIVGGLPARPHSWPWQVSLRYRFLDNANKHICGGTVINDTIILTAAHCFLRSSRIEDYYIVAGDHDQSSESDGPTQSREIAWLRVHERFDAYRDNFPNDIALVALGSPLLFNDNVSAACLPSASVEAGRDCYVTGWGLTLGTGVKTILNQVRLPIIDLSECRQMPGYSVVLDSMICAGHSFGGRDSCEGDSGGPLVCKADDDDAWHLQGIVSWGFDCAKPFMPSVNTRVFSYLDWIRMNISR